MCKGFTGYMYLWHYSSSSNMMASLTVSWVWFFVILTGASNGYPTKKALDPHSAYIMNPSPGSYWEVPANGFVQAESGSSAASDQILHSAPHEQPRYIQPSAQMRPTPAVYSSNTFAAPVYLGYEGSPPSSTKLNFQDQPMKEPKLPGLGHPIQQSSMSVQPGDTSYKAKMYDHGSYHSETEERPPSQYTTLPAMTRFPIGSMLRFGPFVDGFWFGHPYIDRVLMTRKYPSGTYKLSSKTLGHEKNQRHDTIIVDDPTGPGTRQSNAF